MATNEILWHERRRPIRTKPIEGIDDDRDDRRDPQGSLRAIRTHTNRLPLPLFLNPRIRLKSWVAVIKRGHAFTEFLIGLAALPPMEYDQKPLGISLQRWVPGKGY